MGKAARRARLAAIAVSGAAHLALLAILAVQAPMLPLSSEGSGPPEPFIPVLILPRAPPAQAGAAVAPASIRLHRRPQRISAGAAPPGAPVAPLEIPVAPQPPGQPPQGAAAAGPVSAGEGLSPAVRAALRTRLGCEAAANLRLGARERELCNERLGRGAAAAPFMPSPIAPEIRAYYDAVAAARKPDPPPVPLTARGSRGMFQNVETPSSGHGPGFGCHIRFGGPGGGVERPAHGLKLGPLPCFIVPPAGSLTPDVDVQNPDEIVHGRGGP